MKHSGYQKDSLKWLLTFHNCDCKVEMKCIWDSCLLSKAHSSHKTLHIIIIASFIRSNKCSCRTWHCIHSSNAYQGTAVVGERGIYCCKLHTNVSGQQLQFPISPKGSRGSGLWALKGVNSTTVLVSGWLTVLMCSLENCTKVRLGMTCRWLSGS